LFEMMQAMQLAEMKRKYLVSWKSRHPSAKDLGEKNCNRCAFCCMCRPCIPIPEDMQKIAAHMDMNIEELVTTKFVADTYHEDYEHQKWFLVPARTDQEPGEHLEPEDTHSTAHCVFLGDDLQCAINDVKPKSAKIFECWDKSTIYEGDPKEAPAVKAWESELGSSLLELII